MKKDTIRIPGRTRANAVKAYFDDQPWIVPCLFIIAILAVVVILHFTLPRSREAVVTAVGQDCVIVSYQNRSVNSSVVVKIETETAEQYCVGDTVSIRFKGNDIVCLQ